MILIIDDDSAVRLRLVYVEACGIRSTGSSRSPGSYRGSAYGSSGFDTYGYELHSLNDR